MSIDDVDWDNVRTNFYLFSNETGTAKLDLVIEFELAALEVDKAKSLGDSTKIIQALERLRRAVKNVDEFLASGDDYES